MTKNTHPSGWYLDPDGQGQPSRYRYWDGRQWSLETTTTPDTTPKPASARRRGWPFIIGVGLAAAMLAASIGAHQRERALLTPAAEVSHADPTPSESSASGSSESGSSATATRPRPTANPKGRTACAVVASAAEGQTPIPRLKGGGLSIITPAGWQFTSRDYLFDYLADQTFVRKEVTKGWVSLVVLGEVNQATYGTAQAAATKLHACESTSKSSYDTRTGGKLISQAPIKVGSQTGFKIVSEVYVSGHTVTGDVLTVIVVPNQRSGRLGVFISAASIGDQPTLTAVSAAAASLQIEP